MAIDHIRRKKAAKSQVPSLIGAMNNDLAAAEIQLRDMLRITNDYDFAAVDQNGHDILTRKTNVPEPQFASSPRLWNLSAVRAFTAVSVWSDSSVTFRPRAIIGCLKVSR